ncbi:MAG: hypothetical protein ABH807_02345 [Candidatus Shapirobacteria bacterium]
MKNELLIRIYQQPQTVFNLAEVAMLAKDVSYSSLRRRLFYAVAQKRLWRPRRGIYAKKDFLPEELANKIYTPSYLSLQTILRRAGIIFQEYKPLFLVSYLTRTITCQDIEICYQAMPREILLNSAGIIYDGHYAMAIPERAFLDFVFLHGNYHFDNLSSLDWDKVFDLVKIYHSPKLEEEVHKYADTR